MSTFSVSAVPLDLAALRQAVMHPGHGGFCAFEGWVRNRNDGRAVDGLEYEVYDELALAEGERILAEARERFGDVRIVAVHRSGVLKVGDLAVWVGVSSPHRDEAFRACRYVIDAIKHRLPVWKKEHYLDGDSRWVACSHPPAEAERHFTPDYSRQTRLREVGEAGQARLAAARVLVIGAGGLGSPALAYLAGAGVGTLGIVDGDRLEASNLHRQTLYTAQEIGQPKAVLAARRLQAQNPSLKVEVFTTPLTAHTVLEVFQRFDLVLECTDDMRSRYLSNDAAQLAGIPLILASVHQYEGQLQRILPGGPCLRCLWPQPPQDHWMGSCAVSGVLGTVPGILGTMQANEALKQLLGLPMPAAGSLLLVDLLESSTQRLPLDPAAGCAAHGGCQVVAAAGLAVQQQEADMEVAVDSLQAALEAGFHLIDLRDADERAAVPGSDEAQWLPLAELPARRAELPTDRRLLLFCASGRRSRSAVRELRAQGMTSAYSLSGGLQRCAGAPGQHRVNAATAPLHHPATALPSPSTCRHVAATCPSSTP